MATKLTYAEQLKHPNWQRRRLEMLEAADWSCSNCGGKETTLHVHHKQYFKGRMAWEYEAKELKVLCESCHTTEHDLDDALRLVLARTTYPGSVSTLATGLLAGYLHAGGFLEEAMVDIASSVAPVEFKLGELIHLCALQGREKIATAIEAFEASSPGHDDVIQWIQDKD